MKKQNEPNRKPILGHIKKGLGFDSLVREISDLFAGIPDKRQQKKIRYSIRDSLMSGLAMMFLQQPSLLQFQKQMQEEKNMNNLSSLFHVFKIPKDTQMREIIDRVESEYIEKIFVKLFSLLQRSKQLEQFLFIESHYIIAIDGTQVLTSDKISCPCCLTKSSKNKPLRYHHDVLQAVLIHPKIKHVIPIASEFIQNKDGKEKQDCEINAAKRLIKKLRKQHPKLKIMIIGDGLYSKEPFITALSAVNMSYTLVTKPDDHTALFAQLDRREQLDKVNKTEMISENGDLHTYRWSNHIILNGKPGATKVNFIEYEHFSADKDKIVYKNSWVTNLLIADSNFEEIVLGGRARWKIENETFNTLKKQGYHLEHNFGHGEKNLCQNFYLLNLIAFTMHQIFELTDSIYQKVKSKKGTRVEFFNALRAFIDIPGFEDWYTFLETIYDPSQFITLKAK